MSSSKILISADHAGFPLKEELIKAAAGLNISFEDLGTYSINSVDYPDYAGKLCTRLIAEPEGSLGVIVCGSGVGVSIAANRFRGIRAVLAESPEVAKLAREHNHANVLCLGARIVSTEQAAKILKAFVDAKPDQGDRHVRRIKKMTDPGFSKC